MRCVRKSSPYGSLWGGFSFSGVGLPVTLSWRRALGGWCRGRAFNSRGTRGSPALWACLWLDRAYEVHTALISRPRDGRPFCSDPRGAEGGERDLGSPGVTLRVHAGLGSWGPAEGTHWDHGAGLGALRQTHSSPPPTSPGPRPSRPHLDGCEPCPTVSRLPR